MYMNTGMMHRVPKKAEKSRLKAMANYIISHRDVFEFHEYQVLLNRAEIGLSAEDMKVFKDFLGIKH